ncbi:MAG: superoxide dismutase [Flavobacteriaceae bacterium]|nr:superoxide dismutase [Flavobacteriaceae bacterium]|tara:strand:+ start:821 stop:1417 length:597 start_codon:yes stop_codon:yes gene_type:complete
MKKIHIGLVGLALLGLLSCKNDQNKDAADDMVQEEVKEETMVKEVEEEVKKVTLNLESRSGSQATGEATFTETDGKITFVAMISGLEPGTHAIHIHETADCSADDATSSGGHWNPTFEKHGKWGAEDGYHKGDIGNFVANAEGNGRIAMTTDQWCIGCGDEKKDILGKAIIVHKGADDFTSQPSGAAGARVSCGGIIQ